MYTEGTQAVMNLQFPIAFSGLQFILGGTNLCQLNNSVEALIYLEFKGVVKKTFRGLIMKSIVLINSWISKKKELLLSKLRQFPESFLFISTV